MSSLSHFGFSLSLRNPQIFFLNCWSYCSHSHSCLFLRLSQWVSNVLPASNSQWSYINSISEADAESCLRAALLTFYRASPTSGSVVHNESTTRFLLAYLKQHAQCWALSAVSAPEPLLIWKCLLDATRLATLEDAWRWRYNSFSKILSCRAQALQILHNTAILIVWRPGSGLTINVTHA